MKALLIISHGSRREASNTEVFDLTRQLEKQSGKTLSLAGCAFLEMAQPGVQEAIDGLVNSGATEILIFPHFLAAGIHVTRDIPDELDEARRRHPEVILSLLPHLGALPGLSSLILTRLFAPASQ